MEKRRNKADFVAGVAARTGKTKKEVNEVLNAFEEELKAVVTSKDSVRLPGFFEVGYKLKPARKVRNPRTGETRMAEEKDFHYFRFFGDWHNTEEVKIEE